MLREIRADLRAHVGGQPSAVQSALIDRAAMLTLHVALFDARAMEAGGLSERDGRQYLAYSNSLARALAQLGIKPASSSPVSIARQLQAEAAA